MGQNQVDNSIYDLYGDRWYTAFDDPIALLRAESKVKTPWIIERLKKHFPDGEVLDVGCGAGFLSNALARENFRVTGVDLSESSLETAHRHDHTGNVRYVTADAFHLPFADQSFDVVTAMDFLEHVEDPEGVIKEFSRVLRPGGIFVFHTFNRNWLAYLVIIKAVEWLVKNTPRHMHVLRLFIKPSEVTEYCAKAGLKVQEMSGIKPVFRSIPVSKIFSGVVPESLRFEMTPSLKLSYIGYAIKNN
ncbi:MAG: 3-demethylubiquinone-9 3-O-methyltransferase [Bdellovibrionaceae bacterium]|nr:3-demethylubiquinone-9 3-O-methyltransferase [Pseudobdellovibrionaceae bacterium]